MHRACAGKPVRACRARAQSRCSKTPPPRVDTAHWGPNQYAAMLTPHVEDIMPRMLCACTMRTEGMAVGRRGHPKDITASVQVQVVPCPHRSVSTAFRPGDMIRGP